MNPFGGDPRKLMKKLQEQQERVQQEIAALEIEATAGGGMVRVVLDGETIYSKRRAGRFPERGEVVAELEARGVALSD